MTIENKLGECKHIVVEYLYRQKSELSEGYLELGSCRNCSVTITLDESYREIRKGIYLKIKR